MAAASAIITQIGTYFSVSWIYSTAATSHLGNTDMEMRRGAKSPDRHAGRPELVPAMRRSGCQSKRSLGRRACLNARRPTLFSVRR
jgi:hypothetical protein